MTSILERTAAATTTETLTVTDNAKYAWDEYSDYCLHRLPADFVFDNQRKLDAAAIPAMEAKLTAAWAKRGYQIEWVSVEQMESGEDRLVPNELLWQVWAEAAGEVDPYALVSAADLNDVLHHWNEDD